MIGHQGDSDSLPSYGWIKGFERKGENLYADVEFTDTAKDLVKDGHYRKVSISFYSPDSQINPHNGKWSARHLALLGAAPPAVKGLEPFSFSEIEGVLDYAVALDPAEIFDQELGPTIIVERSPLEMLRDKLEEVRNEVSGEVANLQQQQQQQPTTNTAEVNTTAAPSDVKDAQDDNPSQFAESYKGRQTTEIAQQTADLEDNLPEESFMETGKISRKRAKGAHGEVMNVVENVYEEKKEDMDMKHGEMPEAFKKKAMEMKAKSKGKEEMDAKHSEELEYDEVSYKTNPSQGVVSFGKKKEGEADPGGRMKTARSAVNGYADRMAVGKEGADGATGRYKTARSGEQDMDRMDTPSNGEQDMDRTRTAKTGMDGVGEDRWAGQPEGHEKVMNNDQYDDADDEYPEPNRPKTASGNNPAGREDSMTKVPTETEEMPDNEVFAVGMENVKGNKKARVMYQTSAEGRQTPKGGPITHAFSEDDDEMSAEHNEESGDMMDQQGHAKFKKGQLDPGQFEGGVAQISGPDGVFAESYRGEKKATGKQLTPGAMDETDDPAQITGPDGVYAEGAKKDVRKGKGSEGDFEGGPGETTLRSGGVYAEDMDDEMDAKHSEKSRKDPYTKTGFGTTAQYEEAQDEDGDGDDFNELSTDHCGMNGMSYGSMPKMGMNMDEMDMDMGYGGGSMSQPMADGYPSQMFKEMEKLKSEMAELQHRYKEEKMMNRRRERSRMMHSFVEGLYEEGRLTDGIMPQDELVSYCEGLEFGTLEFSEGETAATKLLGLLSKLPPMVSYGEVVQGGTFQYAEEDLDPHSKALKMVESEGIDYVEALKKTMFSA